MAEDVAQEALIRAWRHRDQLRDADNAGAWFTQITRREASRALGRPSYVRARGQASLDNDRPELGLAAAYEDAALAGATLRADVQAAIACLDPLDQTLIRLRYDEDLTQAAIAKRLDLPEGTVKVRLHRARERLRNALASWVDTEGLEGG
jgi:RNA polymerase sigma-70 factor (ECF subfamily)